MIINKSLSNLKMVMNYVPENIIENAADFLVDPQVTKSLSQLKLNKQIKLQKQYDEYLEMFHKVPQTSPIVKECTLLCVGVLTIFTIFNMMSDLIHGEELNTIHYLKKAIMACLFMYILPSFMKTITEYIFK